MMVRRPQKIKIVGSIAGLTLLAGAITYFGYPTSQTHQTATSGSEMTQLQQLVVQLNLPSPFQRTVVDKNCKSDYFIANDSNCLRSITLLYRSTNTFAMLQRTLLKRGWDEVRQPTAAINPSVQTYAFSKFALEGRKVCIQGYINHAAAASIPLLVSVLAPSDSDCR